MKKAMSYAKEFFHRADIFLLVMGLICAIFGIVVISSATASYHSAKYVIVQSASLILGVFAFVVMTVLDVDVLADKWQILCAFNVVFLLLLIPFGVSDNTGNTGWLRFFGIGIQPTEVVKLTFIIILAKQISYLKEYHDLNSVWSVAQLAGHFVLLFGLILVVSSDLGSALIFFSIFLVMLFAAGFALHWFAIGFAAIAAMIPLLWKFVLHDYQKNRILAPYDSSIDPTNTGINWQPHQSKIALASGQDRRGPRPRHAEPVQRPRRQAHRLYLCRHRRGARHDCLHPRHRAAADHHHPLRHGRHPLGQQHGLARVLRRGRVFDVPDV